MDRKDVYNLIDAERDYQDTLGSDRIDGHKHLVGEELVLLQVYTQKALDAWVNNPGEIKAMAVVLKVAAIAVRCIENNTP